MLFKLLAITALAGAAVAQEVSDLSTLLTNVTELSNFTSYLQLFPEFTQTLASLNNFTLLAPNNEAFEQLMNSSMGEALNASDTSIIEALFSYHVLEGTWTEFNDTQFIPTSLQQPEYSNVTGGQVVGAYSDNETVTFVSGMLSIANVTGEPLNFTGGIIHIVDSVLMIPQNVSETAIQLNLTAAAGALTNATLVETVDQMSDVTIFVPSNEAFSAIGSALPNLTMEELTAILQYHVVEGVVGYSTDLENGTSLTTLQGNNVTIYVEDDTVFVNSARVINPDVLVANGVIHVIDNVLNPENATATADPTEESGRPAFPDASSASDVPFTTAVPTPTTTVATESAPGATAASSSGSEGAAMPMRTGAVGAAALFGGAALAWNM